MNADGLDEESLAEGHLDLAVAHVPVLVDGKLRDTFSQNPHRRVDGLQPQRALDALQYWPAREG